MIFLLLYVCSFSCAIDDGQEVVLTGGEVNDSGPGPHPLSKVTRYNMQGKATTLPGLNTPRSTHACGTIKKSDGATVEYTRL